MNPEWNDKPSEPGMEENSKLMDAVREWAQSEPDGLERLKSLPIPDLPVKRWRVHSGWLAKAAIFVIGFALGILVQNQWYASNSPMENKMEPPQGSAIIDRETHDTSTPTPDRASFASARPVERTYEEDGKIVIETELKSYGTRAVWVVDGSLKLNDEALEKNNRNEGDIQ